MTITTREIITGREGLQPRMIGGMSTRAISIEQRGIGTLPVYLGHVMQ